jgi:hypothetical protein
MAATDDAELDLGPDSPAGVLAAARAETRVAQQAEARRFALAAEWALLHPVDSILHVATVEGTEEELRIAGPGAPPVAEFCVAEFALAVGMSTAAGQRYLGDAVETRYRLPRLWGRVVAGQVPVWKARRIAQATLTLPPEGATYVDVHLAPVAERCTFAALDRAVEEARARFDPDEVEARRAEAAEGRHFDIALHHASVEGLVHVQGTLDLADALALDAAIAARAHALLTAHPDLPLDVRRAMAAGTLASVETGSGTESRREVQLYVHLDAEGPEGLARVENTRSLVTVEQVAEWCQVAGTRVVIRPVLDLNANLHTDGYRPTVLQREQAVLIHPTCVFPRCTRPARSCDIDHVIPYAEGGQTETDNLAPLCRRHHRLKTHTPWHQAKLGATFFEWTSPHGLRHTS